MPTNRSGQLLTHRTRPRTPTCSGAQSDSLDHVCGPPHTAINEQLKLLVRETQPPPGPQLPRHLDEYFDTGPSEVKLPTTMIRKHDSS